jgi:hypothetical protein
MSDYPQLGTGALSQFPAVKRRRMRTVVNQASDGSAVKLADAAAEVIEWQLAYTNLSDAEIGALQQFFEEMEGSLQGFTFPDPCGNLMAWSEDLNNAAWSADPLLTATGGIDDPLGGTGAWHLINIGAGPQALTQTLNVWGGYTFCFSVYARASTPATVTLQLGGRTECHAVARDWRRLAIAGGGDPAAESVACSIQLPGPGTLDVFGPQVQAQPAASAYQRSSAGGVYENARFRDDDFSFTTTGINRHSTTVNIVYAKHL